MPDFPLRRKLAGASHFLVPGHDYWHPYLPPIQLEKMGGGSYYLDFTQKIAHPGPFDEKGIPLTVYGASVGPQYYVIDICQYALGHHESWLQTGRDEHMSVFLNQAEWLSSTLCRCRHENIDFGLWQNAFDWRGVKAPWPSAMAQGQGVSVLVRAYRATGGTIYLEMAHLACRAFNVPVENGGVTRFEPDGIPYFEEMPTREPSRILNGFVFALWGLLDYATLTSDTEARRLYDGGLQCLERYLPKYDVGFWSRYDLRESFLTAVSSAFYQELHVSQLLVLHKLSGNPLFDYYAVRWRNQLARRRNRYAALFCKILSQAFS